jgi:broad specificity phosphatase PhoE
MRVYLVRHGEAKPKEVDPERGLTAAGRREVEAVARSVAGAAAGVPRIWHSGKRRAAETAEILAQFLSTPHEAAPESRARQGLDPDDPGRRPTSPWSDTSRSWPGWRHSCSVWTPPAPASWGSSPRRCCAWSAPRSGSFGPYGGSWARTSARFRPARIAVESRFEINPRQAGRRRRKSLLRNPICVIFRLARERMID